MRIIFGNNYVSYKKSLQKLDISSLSERREQLCLQFAIKCTKNPQTQNMFPEKKKIHNMDTRNEEKYIVYHAKTERLKRSSILYMQNLLNQNNKNLQ